MQPWRILHSEGADSHVCRVLLLVHVLCLVLVAGDVAFGALAQWLGQRPLHQAPSHLCWSWMWVRRGPFQWRRHPELSLEDMGRFQDVKTLWPPPCITPEVRME